MNAENPITHHKLQSPKVTPFFDQDSNTLTYVVQDPTSVACAVIDSVMDFDYASGATSFESADRVVDYIRSNKLELVWQIETHVHADHLSAASYIQQKLGGKIGIGSNITCVQKVFGKVFNEGSEFELDGSQFDHLFSDGETYLIGNLQCRTLHTPGHTPACMTHVLGDAVFVGDTLFMPDGGTARADFPGGDAKTLYQSIHRILSLPDDFRIFVCHDYMPDDRELAFETTVGEQKSANIHVNSDINEASFVSMREARDKTLGMPKLIFPSLQVNMRAGHLPDSEENGTVYLKVPLNAF
jgi:glyoxylase-like metal-dependent hydrolase (beta-lactamase superfamily II)